MDCYFHPGVEGVVQCGNCGVAMCRECEANAFLRTNNGSGQALCNRCSLDMQAGYVAESLSWLRKRAVKLVICTVIALFGLTSLNPDGMGVVGMFLVWAVAGLVSNIGTRKGPESVGTALFNYDHPFMSFIGSIIGYALAAPVFIVFGLIGFLRTLVDYKKAVKLLDSIKAVVFDDKFMAQCGMGPAPDTQGQSIAANTQGQA